MCKIQIKYEEDLNEIKSLLYELESRFLSEEYKQAVENIEKISKRITNIIRKESIVSNKILKEKFYLK